MIHSERDIWVFPASVDFEKTAIYTKKYREMNCREVLFFDLSNTIAIHTSFVGLLISIKHDLEKNGGKLFLTISGEIEKIFEMMKISDYLASTDSIKMLRKTA
jgi:anti-anti-sigma regulatory factor